LSLDSRGLGYDDGLRLVGQTPDGTTVWLVASRGSGAAVYEEHLWEYRPSSGASRLVGDTSEVAVWWLIPSPDQHMLAVVQPFAGETTARQEPMPLHVIDARSGTIRVVARPPWHSGARLTPICWSASVARRLYFADEKDTLWRLDMAQPPP